MKVVISVESSSDCPKDLAEQYHLSIIPFTIIKGDKTFKDGEESLEELFAFVEESGKLPRTSAINCYEFETHFAKLLSENDAVVHVSMSHACSSAYQNACAAAEKFPGKVYVVDSLVFHTGQLLLALYGAALVKQGLSAQQIAEKLQERAPSISTTATLEKVNYLYKGGRCNALALLGANLLRLRPEVELRSGEIKLAKKFRGNLRKWTGDYIEDRLSHVDKADKRLVFVSSTSPMEEAVALAKEKLLEAGFQEVIYVKAGATIGTHTGPGTFSIEFFADGEHTW